MNPRYCLTPSALLLALTLLSSNPSVAEERVSQQVPRVAGIVLRGDDSLVIIETSKEDSRLVRVGDMVEGWGRIEAVTRRHIRLWTPNGERLVRLKGGVSDGVPGLFLSAEELMLTPQDISVPAVTAEMKTEIKRLAKRTTAVGEDLNKALKPFLELPKTSRIVAVDHEPLSRDAESVRYVQEAFKVGNTVRLSIEGADGRKVIYLSPNSPEERVAPL